MRAHRQAWAWQDEWHGLTMDAIREFERETQLLLKQRFGGSVDDNENRGDADRGADGDSDGRRGQVADDMAGS